MKNGLFIDQFGTKVWFKDDLYHREDGPAIEWSDGDARWYYKGKLHRLDGPAIDYNYYDNRKQWYYKGYLIDVNSQEDFERQIKLKLFW